MVSTIKHVLGRYHFVVFAYLYGSSMNSDLCRDIDIAVYSKTEADPFRLSVDLKLALSEKTGKSPDFFDVRVINHLIQKGDLFSLLYLRDVLNRGKLLVDKSFQERATFIEAFSMKFRECQGLIAEVCS